MTIEKIPISDRATWLQLRTKDITASDVPAVCGEGVYGTAAQVWAHKRGMIPATEMTEPMKRGIWFEPAVFEALAMEKPEWIIKRAKVYLRDSAARLGATPDGVAIDPDRPGIGVVQAKVIGEQSFRDKWLRSDDDDPHDPFALADAPLGYQLQTLTEGMLAEAQWGVVAALIVGNWKCSLRLFPLERHAIAEDRIRAKVAAFWDDYLDPGIQPPVDLTRDEELLKALHPRDNGQQIDLSGDNELPAIVDKLTEARAASKDSAAIEKECKTAIMDKMGPAMFATLADGRTISAKTIERAAYTVAAGQYRPIKILKGKPKW